MLHFGRSRCQCPVEPSNRRNGPGEPSALASLGGLISPFTLLGGVLRWLQAPRGDHLQTQMIQATVIGHYGWVYGVVFVVLTAAAIGGLIARYRKVGVA